MLDFRVVILLTSVGVSSVFIASADSAARSSYANDPGAQPLEPPATAVVPFTSFSTRYASFKRSEFSELPGWTQDNLSESWKAFRESCNALSARSAWQSVCTRARAVPGQNNDAIRRFIEREFALYQIQNKDLSPAGVITGYYEPLLNGSLKYGGKYRYPVHGVPNDLLYLDSRAIGTRGRVEAIDLAIQGRTLIPTSQMAGTQSGRRRYTLDLGDSRPDIRDKKLRVRIQGDRIVPYYSRAEIEEGALTNASVILWVDSAVDLYIMQIQGSGKVRLPNGELVRVGYAEQNGHPFLPPLRVATRGGDSHDQGSLIRGVPVDLSGLDDEFLHQSNEVVDPQSTPALTRGLASQSSRPPSVELDRTGGGNQETSPEVARVIEILLQERARAKRHDKPETGSGIDRGRTYREGAGRPSTQSQQSSNGDSGRFPPNRTTRFGSDPSYVFFRKLPTTEGGPIGALGVPLTAGRSIAVDPRTTPLGFPVYISTDGSTKGSPTLQRLMFAQDTGGAIRGAVRADYFWGFGSTAAERASHMKQSGRMWLLLPKDQKLPSIASAAATRGGGGGDAEAECVVPDDELCVE